MDFATIIGVVLAFGALFAMLMLEGSHLTAILLPAPMVLVFGATIAVGLAGGTLKDFLQSFKAVPKAIKGQVAPPQEIID
jgi:chemotaxis protein MotA